MSDAGPSEPARVDPALRPLEGGKLLAEITNRIVSLMREHYGRGPIKAKTYVLDNLIVCVLSDGFTAIERTMIEGGEPERVLETRRDFQRMMNDPLQQADRRADRQQGARVPEPSPREPDLTIEMFLMDGPPAGFAALELVDLAHGSQSGGPSRALRRSTRPCSAVGGQRKPPTRCRYVGTARAQAARPVRPPAYGIRPAIRRA